MDIREYFIDLFSSDATSGLYPYDEDGDIRCWMEGEDVIIQVKDITEGDWDYDEYEFRGAPEYEIRISPLD